MPSFAIDLFRPPEAAPPRSLLALLATLEPIDDDFSPIADAEPDDVQI
jgi:antitoxin VapB